ncbi:MAG: phosphoglucosamine mutase [Eggerthellaceae bacterium]|jgi:phosphoglucosamine mutase
MSSLFGTDGARGLANTELTCQTAYRLGQAAVAFMGKTIVIGKDTRLSGDMLAAAVSAGIMSLGGTVLDAGIIPTPAIALITRKMHADAGVVISASHNPPEYNGIKFFDGQGYKLPVAKEKEIEEYVVGGGAKPEDLVAGDEVGIVVPIQEATEIYIQHAVDVMNEQGIDFSGWKIALDAGHGASSGTTVEALRRLGADVTLINDDFNGTDINVECGSTHLEPLKRLVAEIGADVGIAHDGDADRVMIVDADGNELDGDVIEAVCAVDMKDRGLLAGNTAVTTIMCNLGFRKAMQANGISVERMQVGDRHVLERMREGGFSIGGEQSGHMIFLDYNSTGDGMMTACLFLAACVRAGKTVSQAAQVMQRCPQVLVNVQVKDKDRLEENQPIADAVAAVEQEMGDDGQVLVRASGTEPVIRIMVEAPDLEDARRISDRLVNVVERELA